MGNYEFNEDLDVAKKTEQEVAELLTEKLSWQFISSYDGIEYDLKMKSGEVVVKVESKEDFMCAETGNIAVEKGCRGKASGIMATESEYYVYVVHRYGGGKSVFVMRTEELKNLIRRKQYKAKVFGGDDGSNTEMYLFSQDIFDDEFFDILKVNQ